MSVAQIAILKTLCYSDVFSYPLTRAQLWLYLPEKGVSYTTFSKSLEMLIKNKKIVFSHGYFALPQSRKNIMHRFSTELEAPRKIKKALKVARLLSKIPFVKMVGISGSLALKSAAADDDIDLFIITSSGLLWSTRLLCTVFLDLLSLRRRPGQHAVKDKICINMFLSCNATALKERDLYTAHEIVQMVPLINKQNTYENFIAANKWIGKYLPHAAVPKMPIGGASRVDFGLAEYIDTFLFHLQLLVMRKRTTEIVELDQARFHPNDARKWVLREYKKRLALSGIRS